MTGWLLIGNPENRRVTLFQQALADAGQPPARVVPWLSFLEDPSQLDDLPDQDWLVRIDSPGENWAVDKQLLAWGHDDAIAAGVSTVRPEGLEPDRGWLLCPMQLHLGLTRALGEIEAIAARHPRWQLTSSPSALARMFDKRVTSRRYRDAGIPVPEPVDGIVDLDSALAALRRHGWPAMFLKLACSSSAAGIGILTDRPSFSTTIEDAGDRWYNVRKLRRLRDPAAIDRLIRGLAREGLQAEQAVRKARLDGDLFDCRVLVVAGEPAFTVVRHSKHPITNLHLGGWRGDVDQLRRTVPSALYDAAMDSCRRVAALEPVLSVGVDLLYEAGWTGHRILEANAFGDLLPRLQRDGLDVYGWQIRAAQRRAAAVRSG